jgi:uncharacterized protein Yka (UPF0111/DUF47 family)
LAARIKHCESAGDDLTHEILVKLNRTFVTPFDREAMPRLEKLNELQDYTISVNSLEEEADELYRSLLSELLAPGRCDHSGALLSVLTTKEVVEILEEAADAFEAVANTVESIAVKEG